MVIDLRGTNYRISYSHVEIYVLRVLELEIQVDKFVSFRGHVKRSKSGGMYNDEEYNTFRQLIQKELYDNIKDVKAVGSENNAYDVYIEFLYPPLKSDPKRIEKSTAPDLDNIAKSVLDAMEGIVYKNDSQVTELHLRKVFSNSVIRPTIIIQLRKAWYDDVN